jgi:putative exosortase-associated protein (TIGR04073 family)
MLFTEAPPRPQRSALRPGLLASARQHGALLRRAILFSLCIVGLLPASVTAENTPARKLGRGAANLGLGVMAIPSQVIDTTRTHGPTVGVTWGLIKGTGLFVATEAVGLFELMTCPFATPPGYTPILDPEFPWQRFTAEEPERRARKVRTATAGGRRDRE